MSARDSIGLFSIRGIRIGVDWSWFFVLFLIIYWLSGFYERIEGPGGSQTVPYVLAVSSALLFFGSILLHELGHAIVALRRGIGIRAITLWMFGGLAVLERDSDSAETEFKVAAAGPLVTLVIAAALTGAGVLAAGADAFWDAMLVRDTADTSGPLAMVAWLAFINWLMLGFNLIPAYPLDGGRIARAISWRISGDANRASRFAARMGQVFSYGFIGLGLTMLLYGDAIGGIWLAFIGFMLASSARTTAAQSEVKIRLAEVRVADVMDDEPVAIPDHLTIEAALEEYFLRYRWPWFPVVDGSERFTGLLQRGAADAVPEDERVRSRVADIADVDSAGQLRVGVDDPLDTVLGNAYIRKLGAIAAVDAGGRLRGMITLDQLGRALRDSVGAQADAG